MRRPVLAALGVAALAAAGVAQAAPSADRGLELVRRNCSMCHAIGEAGDSPNKQAPRFRELGRRYPIDDLAEALAEGILTGHPAMPQFRFSPAEVDDIIAYLKSIQVRNQARNGQARQ
jgi:mono/diheme cytochrome c family protein